MFSVSLFVIALRKLSTRPKPQVSQEREGKNTIKTKSPATSSSPGRVLAASTPPSAEAPLPVPLESPSLQAVPGVSAKPLSPFTVMFVPPSASSLRHSFPLPVLWPSQGLQPMNRAHGPLALSSKLPHPHLQVIALTFSRKGPGVWRPRLQIPALPLSR